jgi:cytochrome c biogenesis protein CcdA
MLRILGLVVCIGLADSVSPSTSLTGLFLAAGQNPRRSVLEFAAGVFAVFLLAGLILTLGPGAAILSVVPSPSATTRYILETIAGVAMLLVAARLWRRRGSGKAGAVKVVEESRRGPAAMGVAIAALELPTAFPYFAAIAAIVGSGVDTVSQVILVGVYCVCFVLPLLGIALAITIAGEPAVERLMRARRWLTLHWPMLLSRLALVAGVFVVTLGVTGLTLTTPGDTGQFSRGLRHLLTHPLQQ